jgi:hypothetical protein
MVMVAHNAADLYLSRVVSANHIGFTTRDLM